MNPPPVSGDLLNFCLIFHSLVSFVLLLNVPIILSSKLQTSTVFCLESDGQLTFRFYRFSSGNRCKQKFNVCHRLEIHNTELTCFVNKNS